MSAKARTRVAIAAYLGLKTREKLKNSNKAKKKCKKRSMWVREWILQREEKGFAATLYEELKNGDENFYKNFVCMRAEDFDFLLEKVSPLIKKEDTPMRKAIPPLTRLILTLRYLATGKEYNKLMNQIIKKNVYR